MMLGPTLPLIFYVFGAQCKIWPGLDLAGQLMKLSMFPQTVIDNNKLNVSNLVLFQTAVSNDNVCCRLKVRSSKPFLELLPEVKDVPHTSKISLGCNYISFKYISNIECVHSCICTHLKKVNMKKYICLQLNMCKISLEKYK
jgi:hypothetical protein